MRVVIFSLFILISILIASSPERSLFSKFLFAPEEESILKDIKQVNKLFN